MDNLNNYKTLAGTDRYELRVLDDTWNERLIQMSNRAPVRTDHIKILFDRSPDIFTIPRFTSYKYRCLGLFNKEQFIGFAIACYQKRYINGEIADVIYLGNMHAIEKGAGSIFLEKLSERFMSAIPKQIPVDYWYAYVMDTNRAAMRLANLGKLHSKAVGKITMSLIFLANSMKEDPKYSVREANPGDIDQIVSLLQEEYTKRFLAPEMNREVFQQNLEQRPDFNIQNYLVAEAGDEIIGTCAIWDMTAFKKNRMMEYSTGTNIIRKLINGITYISGKPPLPKTGEAFRDATITEYAVLNRDPKILESLLQYGYEKYRSQKYHYLIFGGSPGDPLQEALQSFITKDIRSNVIVGSGQKKKVEDLSEVTRTHADAIQI